MLTVRVTNGFLTLNITCFFVFGAFKVLSSSYLEIHRMGVMALEGNPSTREAGAQCRHSELEQSELQSETHSAVGVLKRKIIPIYSSPYGLTGPSKVVFSTEAPYRH